MILIGETGATKTDWRLLDGESIQQFVQEGFNATTHDSKVFVQNTKNQFQSFASDIDQIHLYLAGGNDSLNRSLKVSLQQVFPKASIHLATDLVAAARALYGKEPGIVGIIGTGANACIYDGNHITEGISPLGYILGDEGSGNYLGRQFLRMYLRGQFSANLTKKINEQFGEMDENSVLQRVYSQAASTYLASFVRFLIDNQNDEEIYQLIHRSFHDYFDAFRFPKAEKTLKYRFTGSVAHFLGNILRKVASERGITLDLIVQSPIAGLTLYHQQNE